MTALVFRRLTARDGPELRDHLLRLDHESRILRFAGHVSDASIEAYAAGFDFGRDIAIGAFHGERLAAVGEARLGPGMFPDEAEVAFSVEQPLQGRGIGKRLANRVFAACSNRGIRTVSACCLAKNRSMLRLAASRGLRVSGIDGVETSLTGSLPQPGPMTVLLESGDLFASMAGRMCGLLSAATPRLAPPRA